MTYGQRLVVQEPDGTPRGLLNRPLKIERVSTFGELFPTLTVTVTAAEGNGSWLADDVRVVREIWDEVAREWVEHEDSTFITMDSSLNAMDQTRLRTFHLVGPGWFLARAPKWTPSSGNPAHGSTKQVKRFTEVTYGAMVKAFWQDAQTRGWGTHLSRSFDEEFDSNGAPWVDLFSLEVPVEMGFDQFIMAGVASDAAEHSWTGFTFNAYLPGTVLAPDLTEEGDLGSAAPTVRYEHGVTDAPETMTRKDLATMFLATYENGQTDEVVNTGAVSAWGELGLPVAIGGVEDSATAQKSIRLAMRVGKAPRETITRTIDLSDPRCLRPDLDLPLGALCRVERTRLGADNEERINHLRLWSIQTTTDEGASGKVTGSWTFGDKRENAIVATQQRLQRMVGGTRGGFQGQPAKPGDDNRRPMAPAALTVVPTTYADPQTSASRGRLTITIPVVTTDIDGEPLEIIRYELQSKADDQARWKDAPHVDADQTEPLILNGFDPLQGVRVRARAVSWMNVRSDWSPVSGPHTFDDTTPPRGASLVLDAPFRDADIKAKRAADAGAGFSFALVSGEYVAQFTTTAPTLRLGVGGSDKAGRAQVVAGERYVVSAEVQRVGGTAASGRLIVVWYDAADAVITTPVAVTTVATTSFAEISGTVTAPSGARTAAMRVAGNSFSGSPTLRVRNPRFDRQAASDRIMDDAVITAKIANLAVATGKVADLAIATGKISDLAVATGKIANFAVLNGKVATDAVDGRTVVADAIDTVHIAANVDILGVITTGSGLSLGGTSAGQDVDFPSGGTLGDSGSSGLVANVGAGLFHVAGSGTYSGTWAQSSTRASKVAIKPITIEQAKRLLDLDPVTFKFREAYLRDRDKRRIPAHERVDRPTGRKRRVKEKVIPGRVDKRRHAGLIAEDIEDAGLEELLTRNEDGSVQGVQYEKVTPYLLRLVQDQERRIAALEAVVSRQST